MILFDIPPGILLWRLGQVLLDFDLRLIYESSQCHEVCNVLGVFLSMTMENLTFPRKTIGNNGELVEGALYLSLTHISDS